MRSHPGRKNMQIVPHANHNRYLRSTIMKISRKKKKEKRTTVLRLEQIGGQNGRKCK